MKARPRRIVIVGRPNVGKSTLFNRLTGRRSAIVHDEPGVTRDWTSSPVDLDGRAAELVDTGGIDLADEERLVAEGRRVALEQLGRADLLLFLVDGAAGPTAGDFEVADLLRPLGRPVVLAVNKCDTKAAVAALPEFHAFGFGDPVGVSAQHGTGTDDLREALRERLPEGGGDARPADDTPRVAVVGRPNVGKSSLVNRLLGEERMIVSEVPGTTRDSVDSMVRVRGKEFLLVDTAGIRKRTRTSGSPDELAVILAKKSLERCDVAVLVLDASAGPTSKDAAIAGLVVEARRPAVILANKWDLKGKEGDAEELKREIRRKLPMLDFAEVVFVSAHSGRRTGEIWNAVERARAAASHRVTTGELNRWIADVVARGPSFVVGGTIAKLRYAAQVGIRPPTIALFTSRPGPIAPPVARYLENRLRESFPAFSGAPVIIRTTGGRRPTKP